jgi:hypothetical protein
MCTQVTWQILFWKLGFESSQITKSSSLHLEAKYIHKFWNLKAKIIKHTFTKNKQSQICDTNYDGTSRYKDHEFLCGSSTTTLQIVCWI